MTTGQLQFFLQLTPFRAYPNVNCLVFDIANVEVGHFNLNIVLSKWVEFERFGITYRPKWPSKHQL